MLQNTERQDRSLGEATRSRHDSTLVSFQHPGLRIVIVRLCPNVYHTSEYVLDSL